MTLDYTVTRCDDCGRIHIGGGVLCADCRSHVDGKVERITTLRRHHAVLAEARRTWGGRIIFGSLFGSLYLMPNPMFAAFGWVVIVLVGALGMFLSLREAWRRDPGSSWGLVAALWAFLLALPAIGYGAALFLS